jgi:hypothetical protein
MALLDNVTAAQMRQDLTVDTFIARELAPLYVAQTDRVHKQGEMLGLAIKEAGPMSRDRLRRLVNFELLAFTIRSSVLTVTDTMIDRLEAVQEEYLRQGFADAQDWAEEQGIDPGGVVFSLPSNQNVFDHSMFQTKWESLGQSIAGSLEDHLLEALPGSAFPEKVIEEEVDRALGGGMVWATAMTSMALWSFYRTGNYRYTAASGIEGWFWKAILDLKTCPSCVALHGTWHPNSEQLSDHPRGRCVPVPARQGATWDGITGADWFRDLPPEEQEAILGGARFRAYEAGEIDVDDFSGETLHPVHGSIRRAASLREILGPRASDFYAQ